MTVARPRNQTASKGLQKISIGHD